MDTMKSYTCSKTDIYSFGSLFNRKKKLSQADNVCNKFFVLCQSRQFDHVPVDNLLKLQNLKNFQSNLIKSN